MRKLLSLILLVMLFFAGANVTNAAPIEEMPSVDLVQMFGNQRDVVVSGVKLTSIMKIRLNSTQTIGAVYNQIYYQGIGPNQIVCKTEWMGDSDNSKIVQKVMWSVWYQPGAMVAKNRTECVDSLKKPWVTNSWYKEGYRWLGSGFEPYKSLLWLGHWTEIQKNSAPKYKWCRAAEFSFAIDRDGDFHWDNLYKKAVFDYNTASRALALVSRDIVCTNDVKTYSKWIRTPGWSFVFVEPLY